MERFFPLGGAGRFDKCLDIECVGGMCGYICVLGI